MAKRRLDPIIANPYQFPKDYALLEIGNSFRTILMNLIVREEPTALYVSWPYITLAILGISSDQMQVSFRLIAGEKGRNKNSVDISMMRVDFKQFLAQRGLVKQEDESYTLAKQSLFGLGDLFTGITVKQMIAFLKVKLFASTTERPNLVSFKGSEFFSHFLKYDQFMTEDDPAISMRLDIVRQITDPDNTVRTVKMDDEDILEVGSTILLQITISNRHVLFTGLAKPAIIRIDLK